MIHAKRENAVEKHEDELLRIGTAKYLVGWTAASSIVLCPSLLLIGNLYMNNKII